MVVAVRDTLQKHVVSGSTVLCGEKRSRDAFSESDEDAAELEAMMIEVESRLPVRGEGSGLTSSVTI